MFNIKYYVRLLQTSRLKRFSRKSESPKKEACEAPPALNVYPAAPQVKMRGKHSLEKNSEPVETFVSTT